MTQTGATKFFAGILSVVPSEAASAAPSSGLVRA